jgi:hypothetical protein
MATSCILLNTDITFVLLISEKKWRIRAEESLGIELVQKKIENSLFLFVLHVNKLLRKTLG